MSLIINTEHLSLSAKTRTTVEELLSNLSTLVSDDSNIRLFIKKMPKNLLTAVLHIRARGKDFVVSRTGGDLESLVMVTEAQLRRRLVDRKKRRIHLRKRKIG